MSIEKPILPPLEKHSQSNNTECEWVNELFYKYSLRYGHVWEDRMPTKTDISAMKSIFYEALKNFNIDTIRKAINESLIRCEYPNLSKVVEFAEQFARTNRYNSNQITHISSDSNKLEPLKPQSGFHEAPPEFIEASLKMNQEQHWQKIKESLKLK